MKRSGSATLPLHYGYVPQWLYERMSKLGLAVFEVILADYGKDEVIHRMSDPFWFQCFGAVMGMDWHSSGVTTSVMGALKRAVNPRSRELGIYIAGGKGKFSKETPNELLKISETTGLNGNELIRASKLSAKVDNTAIQDGYQLYTHNFLLSDEGNWAVIQQGMNVQDKTARRYHWHSENLKSYVDEPHTGISGINQGEILNLTSHGAAENRNGILEISHEAPEKIMKDISLILPSHHDVQASDVNLKRLGAMLAMTREMQPENFEDLLLLKGVGPRTMQSLALVSEVIHGAPSRFQDPARFSFAHGGKDGHPFPVPIKIYDETINILQKGIEKSKLENSDKLKSVEKLHSIITKAEENFTPDFDIQNVITEERKNSWKNGGKTVFWDAKPPKNDRLKNGGIQLSLF
ncbi:DUF763 domain-containing protein [Chryseobacterium suipulveris]|uniref:DUF763 domain-containing protein n=1 Tax=Chryseobacterium suipulveris TaxID=2929800 RepID=A0ABY4BVW8_9FLAO|nr:DUF763 domain-containing protein [Chryseobacterium suipulveris]UOE42317.1 DUF763 domain-containing protein [Chryseobacterium suipulveris]